MSRRGQRIGVSYALCMVFALAAIWLATSIPADKARAQVSPVSATSSWLGIWAASPQPPYESDVSHDGFKNQTVRNIVHASVGGNTLRVRLSNAFGEKPLTFGGADVAIQGNTASTAQKASGAYATLANGAVTVSGTDRELTFDGKPSVTIPAGKDVYSDPVSLQVTPGQNLAVSLYVPGSSGPTTWHQVANQISYVSNPGDHTASSAATAFSDAQTSYFWVTELDVGEVGATAGSGGAVVTLGDSITDGVHSTLDANTRWPDYLARRFSALPPEQKKSVLDAGISGNRILNDSPCCGVKATDRLERDVFSEAGVKDVILLEGINDIGFSQLTDSQTKPHTDVSADQIIAGMKQIIQRTHAKGLKIYGGTLTPFKGADYYSKDGENKREAVNDFIRNSGQFDGVIDFDAAIRDPQNPTQMLPAYDSGDHLHPNSLGYETMANAVDLSSFATQGATQGTTSGSAVEMPNTGGIPGSWVLCSGVTLIVFGWLISGRVRTGVRQRHDSL